jgi:hypothetical protein
VDQTAPAPGGTPSLDEAREHFLELLLGRFESGTLGAYDYAQRVRAVELASTVAAMADVVDAPTHPETSLDPVDMLLMARATSGRGHRDRRKPYVWLAVVGAFFLVLLVIGMWLVAHARALHDSGNLGARSAPPAAVTGAPVSGSGAR